MIDFFQVFFISMLPVLESQVGIPYGIGALQMSAQAALLSGIAGNLCAVALLLTFLDPCVKFLSRKSLWIKKQLDNLFSKTRIKHSKRVSELGHFALFLFVAIPGPGSGAWTGSLIAYLFGLEKKRAFLLISAGITISGIFIALTTEGVLHLF